MNNKKQLAMALLIMGSANAMQNQDGNTGPSIRQLQFEEDKQPERMKPLSPRAEKPLPILQQTQLYPQNQAKRDIDSNKQMAPRSEMRSKSAKGPGDSDADALYQAKLEQIRLKLTVVVDDQKARFDEEMATMEKRIKKHDNAITKYKNRNAELQAQIDQHDSQMKKNHEAFEIEKQKIQEENEDLQQRLGESQQAVVQLKQDVADADGNILKERNKNQKQINRYREYGDDLINLNPKDDQFLNKLAELQKKVQDRQERRQQRQAELSSAITAAKAGKKFAEDVTLKHTMRPDTANAYKTLAQRMENRYAQGVNTSESEDEKGMKAELQELKEKKFVMPEGMHTLQEYVKALRVALLNYLNGKMTSLTLDEFDEYTNYMETIIKSEPYKELQERDNTKALGSWLQKVQKKLNGIVTKPLQGQVYALDEKVSSVDTALGLPDAIESLSPDEVREKIVEYKKEVNKIRELYDYKELEKRGLTRMIDSDLEAAEKKLLELQAQALRKKVSSVNVQSLTLEQVREQVAGYINDIENIRELEDYKRMEKNGWTETIDSYLEAIERNLLEHYAEALDKEVSRVKIQSLPPEQVREQVAGCINDIENVSKSDEYNRLKKRNLTTLIDNYLNRAIETINQMEEGDK